MAEHEARCEIVPELLGVKAGEGRSCVVFVSVFVAHVSGINIL